ncbi:uncharacterized protein LOC113555731 [Rhopalosiphum maidis]|uniref:uncharacterized protein LOC113555731 n=1 Tax=Rhopalosiphum maidis TaxID=43146 RepID=UPI000EFF48C8|nr:uncharacterized protein LOC113555731 [Rhopalosiphum maidis]
MNLFSPIATSAPAASTNHKRYILDGQPLMLTIGQDGPPPIPTMGIRGLVTKFGMGRKGQLPMPTIGKGGSPTKPGMDHRNGPPPMPDMGKGRSLLIPEMAEMSLQIKVSM